MFLFLFFNYGLRRRPSVSFCSLSLSLSLPLFFFFLLLLSSSFWVTPFEVTGDSSLLMYKRKISSRCAFPPPPPYHVISTLRYSGSRVRRKKKFDLRHQIESTPIHSSYDINPTKKRKEGKKRWRRRRRWRWWRGVSLLLIRFGEDDSNDRTKGKRWCRGE